MTDERMKRERRGKGSEILRAMSDCRATRTDMNEVIEALVKISLKRPLETQSVHQIVYCLASDCFGFSYTRLSV